MCDDDNLDNYGVMKKIGFNAGGHHSFILPTRIKEDTWYLKFLFDQNLYPIYFERSIEVEIIISFISLRHFVVDLEIASLLLCRKQIFNNAFLFDISTKQYLKVNAITDFIKDSIEQFYNYYY